MPVKGVMLYLLEISLARECYQCDLEVVETIPVESAAKQDCVFRQDHGITNMSMSLNMGATKSFGSCIVLHNKKLWSQTQ
ncbi:hypothetical protein TNCT_23551 [Trichonephila clavata]|uniref:Secreted protein n=1 Tax=Trichonephila clavata TaxID=2740835 RepID=A0A8X6H800_TRICU|nr:hypothetical protein TNCT_23551 [Trichonephila clavata]